MICVIFPINYYNPNKLLNNILILLLENNIHNITY